MKLIELASVAMYSTYILRSKKDDSYYIGSTDNLEKRLRQHNSGKSLYTKGRKPFVLAYKEVTTQDQKQKRENITLNP
jgi:putative endonuclease